MIQKKRLPKQPTRQMSQYGYVHEAGERVWFHSHYGIEIVDLYYPTHSHGGFMSYRAAIKPHPCAVAVQEEDGWYWVWDDQAVKLIYWYCHKDSIEVLKGDRCKICGKSVREKS